MTAATRSWVAMAAVVQGGWGGLSPLGASERENFDFCGDPTADAAKVLLHL